MKETQVNRIVFAILTFTTIVLAACVGDSDRPPLSAVEVRCLSGDFERLASTYAEGVNTHDWSKIRQIFNEDIVHHDGAPVYSGIDEIESMYAEEIFINFPKLGCRLGDSFIDQEDGLAIVEFWNLFGYTKDNPTRGYWLFEVVDGRISYWTLLYGRDFLVRLASGHRIDEELLADYAAAWSSDDPDEVASLYAQDAVREDTLFGDYHQGPNEIRGFATDFFSWYPSVRLEYLQSFAEQSPGKVKGGVFAFNVSDLDGAPCAVMVAVLLEPAEEGIERERIYYDAESLVDCGWAR